MFGRKLHKELEKNKAMIAEYQYEFTRQNDAAKALFNWLVSGTPLGKDSKLKNYVQEGYEGNSDLFSIISKLSGMFAGVPLIPMERKGEKYEPVSIEEVDRLTKQTNYFQTWNEFRKHWITSAYVTGNMIVYAPRFTAGVNKGRITTDGLIVMPSQNITIESEGWRNPIGYYTLDIDQSYKINPEDVWHERFAPTLNYDNGKNFMGQSPLKAARNIINAQNAGYEVTAAMYTNQHPPQIIYKESVPGDIGGTPAEQESKFRERYNTKYVQPSSTLKRPTPVFTQGKLGTVKIGYESLRDLQIIESSEHGRRVFCNILGVDAKVFNDTKASTYDNMSGAMKAVYTNRIIPDLNTFCEGFNIILSAYGDIVLKPDFSKIEVLQEDKAKKVEWVSKMHEDGVITGDQYLEMMGEEPTGLPEMQQRYIAANKIPLGYEEGDPDKSNKFYIAHNIQEAM